MRPTRCHWCQRFVSTASRRATVKNPEIFYCPICFDKGLEMEYEAVGLRDNCYTN